MTSETSRNAFQEITEAGVPACQRRKIFEVLVRWKLKPLTSIQIQNMTGFKLTSVLGRINSLKKSGCVYVHSQVRNPESGKLNDAYTVCGPYAEDETKLSEKEEMRIRIEVLENQVDELKEQLRRKPGLGGQGSLFEE